MCLIISLDTIPGVGLLGQRSRSLGGKRPLLFSPSLPSYFFLQIYNPNIRIIGVRGEEDKKKGHEKILEKIIVDNFPKMG